MRTGKSNYGYEIGEDMTVTSSYCSRFTRRSDVNAFNMMDYQSCENCRHMTADNRCLVKGQFISSDSQYGGKR